MKILSLPLILICLFFATATYAADVTLAWDDPGQPWATYVYTTTDAGIYDLDSPVARAESGENQITISNFTPGETYNFVATHYDDASGLESDPSIEISYTVPTADPSAKVVTDLPDPGAEIREYVITISIPE